MAIISTTALKALFETGDTLLQSSFDSLIDSVQSRVLGSGVYATTALMAASVSIDGTVARVIGRQAGYFVFRSGDYSTQVTNDPHGGLYVPPVSDATGASGAWERQVEQDTYEAEWWLPDAMPANAQVRLNTIFDIMPAATARKLIMPRRTTTVTGTVILKHGIEYEGYGRGAAFNGGGASGFFPITIAASHAKLYNISSGNVTGVAEQGEPGGFHVTDGLNIFASDGNAIENVSLVDCHAFSCRTGVRFGYKSTGNVGATTVYGCRDCYCENFRATAVMRSGIECMRAHGVQIVAPEIRMTTDTHDGTGVKRGFRLVGCHNVSITGGRVTADYVGIAGCSIEPAANYSSRSGTSDIVVNGTVFENCKDCFSITDTSRNVVISNCQAIGRGDNTTTTFLAVTGDASDTAGRENRNISVTGNLAINQETFLLNNTVGTVYGLRVRNNQFISNDATAPRFAFLQGKMIECEIVGNTGYVSAGGTGGTFRATLNSASKLLIENNRISADSAGVVFAMTGDWEFIRRNADSNQTLASGAWANVRPLLDQDVYT